MQVKFSDDLLVGHEIIDNQHREWFARLDRFWEASRGGRGPEEVIEALNYLSEYVEIHFAAEEKLQEEIDYPNFDYHKKRHDEFREVVRRLTDNHNRRGADYQIAIDTLNSMLEWLMKHIKNTDKDLAEYIREHRPKDQPVS